MNDEHSTAWDIVHRLIGDNWAGYVWVLLVSWWAAAVSFIQKVRSNQTRPFNLMELAGEGVVSGFVGVITFLMLDPSGLPLLVRIGICGLCAHMGTRGLFLLEKVTEKVAYKRLGIDISDAELKPAPITAEEVRDSKSRSAGFATTAAMLTALLLLTGGSCYSPPDTFQCGQFESHIIAALNLPPTVSPTADLTNDARQGLITAIGFGVILLLVVPFAAWLFVPEKDDPA